MQCTDLIDYKKLSAGGEDHHFRVIQLPYNLNIQDAATINSQVVKGKRMSLLSAAQQLGVSVVASASLMQVSLKYITLLVYHGNCKQSMTKCFFFVLFFVCLQASLCKGLPEETRTSFLELGKNPTDAQCALQFVRTTPGVITGLAGMRTWSHVEENAAVVPCPATPLSGSIA